MSEAKNNSSAVPKLDQQKKLNIALFLLFGGILFSLSLMLCFPQQLSWSKIDVLEDGSPDYYYGNYKIGSHPFQEFKNTCRVKLYVKLTRDIRKQIVPSGGGEMAFHTSYHNIPNLYVMRFWILALCTDIGYSCRTTVDHED